MRAQHLHGDCAQRNEALLLGAERGARRGDGAARESPLVRAAGCVEVARGALGLGDACRLRLQARRALELALGLLGLRMAPPALRVLGARVIEQPPGRLGLGLGFGSGLGVGVGVGVGSG